MSKMFYQTGYSNQNFTLDLGDKFVFTNVSNYTNIFAFWESADTLYVKSATEQSWIVTNSGNTNLTTANVLIRI